MCHVQRRTHRVVDADVVGSRYFTPRHRLTPKSAGRPTNWGGGTPGPHPRGESHASHKAESPANASTKTSQRLTRRGKHTPASQRTTALNINNIKRNPPWPSARNALPPPKTAPAAKEVPPTDSWANSPAPNAITQANNAQPTGLIGNNQPREFPVRAPANAAPGNFSTSGPNSSHQNTRPAHHERSRSCPTGTT